MSGRGGCFLGSAFSCVDILVALHRHVMRGEEPDPDRDRFLLSKGHAVPALYGLMVELGRLPVARLDRHLRVDDRIYWHPHRAMPGVEFHFGSLGHGLPIATGFALDHRLRRSPARVFVLVGDGELNEGSNWEALLLAAGRRLDGLTVIVDRNQLQANSPTEALVPLEPLEPKFRAFGCEVRRVNGHDHDSLADVLSAVPIVQGKPTVVIADTVRGKGIPRIEGDWEQWFVRLSEAEVEEWLYELRCANS